MGHRMRESVVSDQWAVARCQRQRRSNADEKFLRMSGFSRQDLSADLLIACLFVNSVTECSHLRDRDRGKWFWSLLLLHSRHRGRFPTAPAAPAVSGLEKLRRLVRVGRLYRPSRLKDVLRRPFS